MRKVKGFTIVEVLIAMILGSLAIAFSAWVFLIVSKDFKESREEYSFHTEILQLRYVLENDIDKAEIVTYGEDVLKLELLDSTIIYYDFYEKNLVRSINQLSDTFHIATANIIGGYDNNKQPRLNSFSLDIKQNDSTWGTFKFFKQYPESLDLVSK